MICTELYECELDFIYNKNVQIFAIRLPFYNMAVIDNHMEPIYMIKGLLYIDDLDQRFYIFKVEWIYRIK